MYHILHGVKFENFSSGVIKHSSQDLGLTLNSQNIGMPAPKTIQVDISGADGILDLTESFGEVKYNNRTLQFTFTRIEKIISWDIRKSIVANFLHGQKMKISVWSDPDYYYIGRCTVDEYNSSRKKGTIVVTCNCEPYKYKADKTTQTIESGTNTITNNGRKTVHADLTCTTSVTVNGAVYTAGTYTNKIKLVSGSNTITSTGKATLTYREGAL